MYSISIQLQKTKIQKKSFHMFKQITNITKQLFISSLFLVSIALPSVNSQAFNETAMPGFKNETYLGDYFTVNSGVGLNARDEKCNLYFTLKNNTILQTTNINNPKNTNTAGANNEIKCVIGGVAYKMLPVVSIKKLEVPMFYVAEDFVYKIGTDRGVKAVNTVTQANAKDAIFQLKVNSEGGLNVRDFNCNLLDKVADGTVISTKGLMDVYASPDDSLRNFCRVNGRLYHYNYVEYVKNGKTIKGYSASEFLNYKW
jgi:hypothetical protein